MTHTTEKIIDKIKELKGTVLPSGKLILFGSQARRDATTDARQTNHYCDANVGNQ